MHVGDWGWTPEFDRREKEIIKILAPHPNVHESSPEQIAAAIVALRELIEDTEAALNANRDCTYRELGESRFFRRLLYCWYLATKDRSVEKSEEQEDGPPD